MKKTIYYSLAVIAILCGIAWTVRGSIPRLTVENSKIMKTSPTRIQLGNPKDSDLNGPGASIDKHPTGINFYQRDWMRGNLGTVEFMHGKYSFMIDNVLSVLGVADNKLPDGVYEWNISFGVSPEQADTHEAALARMMKLLSELHARGWTRYIGTNHPRLTGKQAWDYMKINSAYSLDASYTPTIEEWKKTVIGRPRWVFYADGVYLDVSLMQSNMGGFVGKTTYLFTIEAMNEYAFYGLGYFPGNAEKIHNWKALLPAKLQSSHAKRLMREAALEAQGDTIDTTYQDPPIKALQDPLPSPQ